MNEGHPPVDGNAQASAAHAVAGEKNGQSGGFNTRSILKFFREFPWTLILILSATALYKFGPDLRGTVLDYAMIIFSVVVLILEVAKSTDIRMTRFVTDLVTSIVGIILMTVFLTIIYLVDLSHPPFYIWMVAGVLTVDSVLSPSISYATALRNMALGGH